MNTYIRELNLVILKFIWNNKRPKIQLNILVQDYEIGGLKMIHLPSFCRALKLSWLKKIFQSTQTCAWKSMVTTVLGESQLMYLLDGSFEYIDKISKCIKNMFWKEFLETWSLHRSSLCNDEDANKNKNQACIWYSGCIKNGNLYNRRNYFIKKGLISFEDLYNNVHQNFRNAQNVREIYDININDFDYMCLLHSIPVSVKDSLKSNINTYGRSAIFVLAEQKKICKCIYQKLISALPYEIKSKQKWKDTLEIEIEEDDWVNIFRLHRSVSVDRTMTSFQYKILHRTLPSNSLLHIYTIRDNPFCDDCQDVTEDLMHLFYSCPKTLHLWYSIAYWLLPIVQLFPYINIENIILGIYKEKRLLENTIILIVKRYIYNCKCSGQEGTLAGLIYYMKSIMILETNFNSERLRNRNEEKWSSVSDKLHRYSC